MAASAAAVPSPPPAPVEGHQRVVRRRAFLVRNARLLLAWGILAALLAVYVQQAPQFRPREQRTIANSGMTLAIAGFGQTLVVLTGGIDLSVGPMVSLTNSLVSATTDPQRPRASMALAAALALLVGAGGGLVNGVLVAYARLQPIIVTLATASIWGGIALYVRPDPGGYVPPGFIEGVAGQAFREPLALPFGLSWERPLPRALFLLAGLVVAWLLFRRTPLATRLYAVGSAEGAAYMSGVDVARTKVWAYTLAGVAAALAGLFTSAQTGTGNALAGGIFTLNSIAAVVLGGASLAGGSGSYLGTLAGAYVIALIPSVLFFFDISVFYQQLFQGSILLLAVALGALGILRVRNRLERL